MFLWWALLGCQEPFDVDRHDLVGFRIAAMQATPADAGEVTTPHVALVVDGRPWSDGNVDLRWFWIADSDAFDTLDPLSTPDAVGPTPAMQVPEHTQTLGLIALHGSDERRALTTVRSEAQRVPQLSDLSLETLPLQISALEGSQLDVEVRRDLESTPADHVPVDGLGRLQAHFASEPTTDVWVRWMSTAGTWFELDALTADWVPGDLRVDDDEIEEPVTPLRAGGVTVLALALGEPGDTRFRAADVYVGPPPAGVWVGGRHIPTDPPIEIGAGQFARGRLVSDDSAPSGLRLVDAEAVDDPDLDPGTDALPCQLPRTGPFDPLWMLEGICSRTAVDGTQVVLTPDADGP